MRLHSTLIALAVTIVAVVATHAAHASAAPRAGLWAVATEARQAGIVTSTGAPTQVAASKVVAAAWLGAADAPMSELRPRLIKFANSNAQGLLEALGGPQAFIDHAKKTGASWMKQTPSGAAWDITPTIIVGAAGGAIVGAAGGLAGGAADGAAGGAAGGAADGAAGGAADGAAGGAAGGAKAVGKKVIKTLTGGDSSSGTAADAFSVAKMAALAAGATLFLAHNISTPTAANLTQDWFVTLYHDIEQYAWVLATVAVAAMGLWVMVSQKGSDLTRVLVGIPAAGVGMLLVPVLAMAGIAFVDAGCQLVPMDSAVHALNVMAATIGALAGTSLVAGALHLNHIAHFTGTGAWMVSAFGLAAAGVVALELIAREIAIYMTVLIVPLALVGSLFAPFARWVTKILTVLFVLLFSKFVLVACLAAVGGLVTSGGVMGVIVGIVALAFVAFVPKALYSALIGLETAFHSGVAHAGLTVVQNRGMAGRVHRAGAQARSAIDGQRLTIQGARSPLPVRSRS